MASIVKYGVARPYGVLQSDVFKDVINPIPVENYKKITFFPSYQRAAIGGALRYTVLASIDKVKWHAVTEIQAVAIVPGTDEVSVAQRSIISYQATNALREDILSPTFSTVGKWMAIVCADTSVPPGEGGADYALEGQA